jgi:pyridoxal 5'-phosphate synthase pdxT subunit
MTDGPLIGVLALQGDFAAHGRVLRRLGARVREVRVVGDLKDLEGIVLPGGESTTMTLGIEREGLREPLRELIGFPAALSVRGEAAGIPVLGSCAGLIMLDRDHLGLMDIRAERNAFGRQLRSFEADIELRGLDRPGAVSGVAPEEPEGGSRDGGPLRAVFIRAPWIAEHGPDVEILAEIDGHPVAARQGRMLAVAFHAELTDDDRVHRLFLSAI